MGFQQLRTTSTKIKAGSDKVQSDEPKPVHFGDNFWEFLSFERIRWVLENENGTGLIQHIRNIDEEKDGSLKKEGRTKGPWLLRLRMHVPGVPKKPDHNARVFPNYNSLLAMFSGMTHTLEVRFSENYPYSMPAINFVSNVEHPYLGSSKGGEHNKNGEDKSFPQVLVMKEANGRYNLKFALRNALCFLTYFQELAMSVPDMDPYRARDLLTRILDYSERNWADRRDNIDAYTSLFSRSKVDFFRDIHPMRGAVVTRYTSTNTEHISGVNVNDFWELGKGARTKVPSIHLPPHHVGGGDDITNRNATITVDWKRLEMEPIPVNDELKTVFPYVDRQSLRATLDASLSQPNAPSSFMMSRGTNEALPREWFDSRFLDFWDKMHKLEHGDLKFNYMEKMQKQREIVNGFLVPVTNCSDVYAFPVFTDEFCDKLVHEVRGVHDSEV